ncbi:hypothetical protein D3Z53_18340 [Lachnospiraceae bacterium]|nr:hypothetical protein [Lachnospiraceae bacterium]
MPYCALFVQSCQEYMGETFIDKNWVEKIQNARNFIKVYGEVQKNKTRDIFSTYKSPQKYAGSVYHNAESRYGIVTHLSYISSVYLFK